MVASSGSIQPEGTQFEALAAADPDEPVVMLNLLRYREQAVAGSIADGMTGRAAYARYGEELMKLPEGIFKGVPVWMGSGLGTVIGPVDERWDDIVLVSYPKLADFLSMAADPEYLAISPWRTAALADSRLVRMAQASLS